MEEGEFGQVMVDKTKLVDSSNPNSVKARSIVDVESQPDRMSFQAQSFCCLCLFHSWYKPYGAFGP
jgi:hypothetical protein